VQLRNVRGVEKDDALAFIAGLGDETLGDPSRAALTGPRRVFIGLRALAGDFGKLDIARTINPESYYSIDKNSTF